MAKRKTLTTEPTIKKTSIRRTAVVENTKNKFLVVGMGASAGGLKAFTEFFESVPDNPGMAFVLVQHLDPTHKSLMVDLLKKHTKMEVTEVKDNTKVVQDHVYVIPPNKDMAVFKGILHLMNPTKARGFRRPIDFFFHSLAEDKRECAVGIVLSGTGTDGTSSLKDIKDRGGLTLVQDPEMAKYDGMPRSAIAAGAQDFVLPVKEMPDALLRYAKNRKFKFNDKPMVNAMPDELLQKVFILLRNENGCNFSDYKSGTVVRRIEKRMALNQIDSLQKYIKHLQHNRKEIVHLFKALLIGVTSFFRDKGAFEALKETVLPEIIKRKTNRDTIRVWVTGCSTGEEAYSLAILFDEAIRKQGKNLKLQVFASDIDEDAIGIARQGIYPDTITVDIGPERLSRYFLREGTTFKVKKELRDQVIFAGHNLIEDPPFSKQDMISCRNLLIYLNVNAQKRIFAIFHYALIPKGILFLGTSESLGEHAGLFDNLNGKSKIFRHKKTQQAKMPKIDYLYKEHALEKTNKLQITVSKQQDSLSKIAEKVILDNYAPACVIINDKGEAVYFVGNTGKYLQPSPGKASFYIMDMARHGLKVELRNLISKGMKSKKTEVRNKVNVRTNGRFQHIDLRIRPLPQFVDGEAHFMITFEDREAEPKKTLDKKIDYDEDLTERHALEQELSATKEYLSSTILELEVSNEELKSANEELQSGNEELRSTNEEMETSKEELHSVNEEIITVNSELQNKIEELAQANNNMSNLLISTEIGTIFLGEDLKIKWFTPSMAKIVNLIQTDVGRPIDHLSSNLIYDGLLDDIKNVLKKLTPHATSVQSKNGTWYKMQIMPYRTSENMIEGVVMTFVDITEEKQLMYNLEQAKDKYEQLLEMTKTVVYTQDKKLRYTSVASIHPELKSSDMVGKSDADFFSREDAKQLESIKKKVIKTEKSFRSTISLKIGEATHFFDLMVRPVRKDGQITGIACASIDVTDLLQTENELASLKNKENVD